MAMFGIQDQWFNNQVKDKTPLQCQHAYVDVALDVLEKAGRLPAGPRSKAAGEWIDKLQVHDKANGGSSMFMELKYLSESASRTGWPGMVVERRGGERKRGLGGRRASHSLVTDDRPKARRIVPVFAGVHPNSYFSARARLTPSSRRPPERYPLHPYSPPQWTRGRHRLVVVRQGRMGQVLCVGAIRVAVLTGSEKL